MSAFIQTLEHQTLKRLSFGNHEPDPCSARASSASTTSFPLWPTGPETPWTLSPVRTSPTSALLYHCLASLHRHEGNIFSITVSRDFIFTSSESSRIYAWKQPDCTDMGYIKANAGEVRAILAHGRVLFTTHGDQKIRLTTTQKSYYIQVHGTKQSKLGKFRKGNVSIHFVAHEGPVSAIVINQIDGCVFTCSSDGTVKIWRRVFGESSHILTMTLKFQPSPVNALALSSSLSGCFLYSGSSDGLINFWEKEKMSCRFNHGGFLQGHHFSVLCLVTVGDLVLSGSEDATIRVWRREEGNTFHSCLAVIMDGHHGPVKCLAASLEMEDTVIGLLVYSASLDQTFKVWRVKVHPTEKVNLEKLVANGQQSEIAECQMNPVLSPSWVEKKIQGSHF
ncbi:hypothetical protein Acr_19g0010050 [Actinidia rufa]|uniref:Transducin/WD40 repeat-like superfamily protein n=1 Tax=Actinidia rufa TaxID=165716 RepID=A0A7J0GBJ7_9ERIC|nr:hypothetical protein Acr_19g0010050 [Actinidia rufa]